MIDDARASSRVGKIDDSLRVWDIPVLFQVRAPSEQRAAEHLANVLAYNEITQGTDGTEVSDDIEIESWHMPEHQSVDGSDSPVRIIVVGSIKDFRIPNHVKATIEKVAAIIAETN